MLICDDFEKNGGGNTKTTLLSSFCCCCRCFRGTQSVVCTRKQIPRHPTAAAVYPFGRSIQRILKPTYILLCTKLILFPAHFCFPPPAGGLSRDLACGTPRGAAREYGASLCAGRGPRHEPRILASNRRGAIATRVFRSCQEKHVGLFSRSIRVNCDDSSKDKTTNGHTYAFGAIHNCARHYTPEKRSLSPSVIG